MKYFSWGQRAYIFPGVKRKPRRVTVDALITARFSLDVNVLGAPPRSRHRETTLPGSFFEMKGLRPYCSCQALRFQGWGCWHGRRPCVRIAVHHTFGRGVLEVEGRRPFFLDRLRLSCYISSSRGDRYEGEIGVNNRGSSEPFLRLATRKFVTRFGRHSAVIWRPRIFF